MCGFVALAGERATEPGRIEAGLAAIRHRGPDGQGVWRATDRRAALGHARLAIIDLSVSGAQPMRSRDGGAQIAYNGEIYNYRELAPLVATPLRSRSDTEVLLELLRARGASAVQLARGMFAFAYWDGEELLLVRDRLGIKPLFWTERAGTIGAASEISALLAMKLVEPRVDLRAVDDYLTYLYVPPPRTGILGIQELPPGHLLRWRASHGTTVERWWAPPVEAPRVSPSATEVRAILEDSARAHLVSDAPVGVFLSGGLDSSTIVALAARHYPGTLKTFNVTFGDEGAYLDERAFAREVASRYATDHREIQVTADVASILPALVEHFGQPFGNPTAVLTYALSRATREHVKVALAGDGGDEVLGGYPRYQGLLAASIAQRFPAPLRSVFGGAVRRLSPKATARGVPLDRLRRFVDGAELPLDTMYFRWSSYLDADRKRALFVDRDGALANDAPTEDYEFFAAVRRAYATRSMVDAASLVDLETFLPHNVLRYGDRMSMAHALEVRVPFCDHIVVEKLAALPLRVKTPFGIQKGLFRRAIARDLPRRVALHRKIGFNPPIAAWLRRGLAPIADDYLSEASVRARGIFRTDAVAKMRAELTSGSGAAAHPIWSLVVLEAWMRWLDAAISPRP
jgi:asparagine synthase (glutamine-hydrolysing)